MKHGNPLNLFAIFGRFVSSDCDSLMAVRAPRLFDRNFKKRSICSLLRWKARLRITEIAFLLTKRSFKFSEKVT